MTPRRTLALTLLAAAGLALAQTPPAPAPPKDKPTGGGSDLELVKTLLAARTKYQQTLEQVRLHYMTTGDLEKARWAEEELLNYHRIPKHAYRLDLDVPSPTLQASYNIPEANELYRRAMLYKDKGWNTDYVDNQRRAELLLQQLLSNYPQSDKIGDAAFQLGDVYESKAYRQYRRSAQYYERAFQWNPTAQLEARLRAARLYDRQMIDRRRARELYADVLTHDTDPRRIQEAQKRLQELGQQK
jgi:hypothetical protein